MFVQNLNRIVSKPNITPGQMLYCTTDKNSNWLDVSGLSYSHIGLEPTEPSKWLPTERSDLSKLIWQRGVICSLRCTARVHHCLRLLVGVVDWCVSQLVNLICCQNILTESSPWVCWSASKNFHQSPSLITFAFRSSEVRRLLLVLDPTGGTDPLGMFPLFLNKTTNVLAHGLSVVFRRLLRLCNFPAYWRHANETIIPKGPPSSSVANYWPIFIITVLSNARAT